MAKFKDQGGNIIELNPDVNSTVGLTPVSDDTPLTVGERTYVKNPVTGLQELSGNYSPASATITGASLAPSSSITPVTPSPTPSDSSLSITEQPIPTETEYEKERKRIAEIDALTAGKGAYQAQQEQELISPEETALADYTTQLRDTQAQQRELFGQMEKGFRGTEGRFNPQFEARSRELTVDALRTSALIDSIQRRIGAAERKIERAIRAKYGALEAERDAKIRNLESLLKSPGLDREEKTRAQAQLDRQNKLKAEEAERKRREEESWKNANTAVQNGLRNPMLIKQIQEASPEEGLRIMAEAGFGAKPDTTFASGSIEEFKYIYKRDPKDIAELNAFTASRGAAGRTATGETLGGALTKEDVGRLTTAGISPDIYKNITKLLLRGIELDEIRKLLREAGEDPKFLDTYDRAVGIEKIRSTPKATGVGTKLDKLLDAL